MATLRGSPTAPSAAGSYAVVCHLTQAGYSATDATGTLVINPAPVTLSLSNLSQTYDGTQKSATCTATPSAAYSLTYSDVGSGTGRVNVGSYGVSCAVSDPNYGATPATGTLVIAQMATTTHLTSSRNPSAYGEGVTFTATVSPSSASGSVTFNGVSGCNGGTNGVALSSGSAACLVSNLPAGNPAASLTAQYGGDTNHGGSSSAPLSQQVNPDTRYGAAVALSGDTALIGAPGFTCAVGPAHPECGAAYVRTRTAAAWPAVDDAELLANDAQPADAFGAAVALYGDTALVGAPGADCGSDEDCGASYVLVRRGGGWTQQAKLTAPAPLAFQYFGTALALEGDTALVGAPMSGCGAGSACGAAYVFVRSGSTWSHQATLLSADLAAGDRFGGAVAISGNSALVGASGDDCAAGADCGAGYVFLRTGTLWAQQAKLSASDIANHKLGGAVALVGDSALLGAPTADCGAVSDCGAVYVFSRSGSTWSQQARLTAADPGTNDGLGSSVAFINNVVAAGAPRSDAAGTDSGALYLFSRTPSGWAQLQKLGAGAASDYYGSAVALTGDTLLVGIHNKDGPTPDAGDAAFHSYPCGFGFPLPAGQWRAFGMPCAGSSPSSVRSLLGDDLLPSRYGPSNRWVVYQRDVLAKQYLALGIDQAMGQQIGYWSKTLDAASLDLTGAPTPLSSPAACPSPHGCYETPWWSPPAARKPPTCSVIPCRWGWTGRRCASW